MISFPVLIYQINFLPRTTSHVQTGVVERKREPNIQSSRQQISCSSQITIFHDSSSQRLLLHDPLSLLWQVWCGLVRADSLSYQLWLVDNGIINSRFLVLARCLGCEPRFSLFLLSLLYFEFRKSCSWPAVWSVETDCLDIRKLNQEGLEGTHTPPSKLTREFSIHCSNLLTLNPFPFPDQRLTTFRIFVCRNGLILLEVLDIQKLSYLIFAVTTDVGFSM